MVSCPVQGLRPRCRPKEPSFRRCWEAVTRCAHLPPITCMHSTEDDSNARHSGLQPLCLRLNDAVPHCVPRGSLLRYCPPPPLPGRPAQHHQSCDQRPESCLFRGIHSVDRWIGGRAIPGRGYVNRVRRAPLPAVCVDRRTKPSLYTHGGGALHSSAAAWAKGASMMTAGHRLRV